jgi:hypothetical protein
LVTELQPLKASVEKLNAELRRARSTHARDVRSDPVASSAQWTFVIVIGAHDALCGVETEYCRVRVAAAAPAHDDAARARRGLTHLVRIVVAPREGC